MKRLLLACLIALMSSQVTAMDSLKPLVWKNRVVLVFGNVDDERLMKQVGALKRQQAELDDRDMVVITVSGNEAHPVHGDAPALDADDLRKEAEVVGRRFHVILVGKDGGIKLRSENVVGDVEMFDLIDRMPMRRNRS